MRRDVSSVALNGMGVDLLGVRICDISVFFGFTARFFRISANTPLGDFGHLDCE